MANEVEEAVKKYGIIERNNEKYYTYEVDGYGNDYFMDDATFQKELSDDQFYADVRKKYGSRGVAQAKKIKRAESGM